MTFAVATGFPAGQTPLQTRLDEIRFAVSQGAQEIDVVINRQYALTGNWKGRFSFILSLDGKSSSAFSLRRKSQIHECCEFGVCLNLL